VGANEIAEVLRDNKCTIASFVLQGIAAAMFGAHFRSLTPGPPPFSEMNSTPAASSALRMALPVDSRPPISPSDASSRLIVGSDIPDTFARSDCDHDNRARAAFTCRIDTFGIDNWFALAMILMVSNTKLEPKAMITKQRACAKRRRTLTDLEFTEMHDALTLALDALGDGPEDVDRARLMMCVANQRIAIKIAHARLERL
jgi:hypothetical protein